MSLINCRRAEVVWCSGVKQCLSETSKRYLLMDGRIRVSRTFAAGQRSGIGRYEVPWVVSLPVFGIGMIDDDFSIDGILFVFTER